MPDKPEGTEVIFQCCINCRQWESKRFVSKREYYPLTLYNVVDKDGKKAKACQNCLPFFKRVEKRRK